MADGTGFVITIPPDKLQREAQLADQGNRDAIGRLCLTIADLRKQFDALSAKQKGAEIQNLQLLNRVATLEGECRQLRRLLESATSAVAPNPHRAS